MLKSCVHFRNSLFVGVYLKEVWFLCGCVYLVFILQNSGSLAPLIFFRQLLFSLLCSTAYLLFLQTYIFFQNIKLSFAKKITFNISKFNI